MVAAEKQRCHAVARGLLGGRADRGDIGRRFVEQQVAEVLDQNVVAELEAAFARQIAVIGPQGRPDRSRSRCGATQK